MKSSQQSRVRVLLVDDHPFLRQGVALTIQTADDLEVCGEAPDSATALDLEEATRPDVVVTDLTLPDKGGLELIHLLCERRPGLKILVLSMHDEDLYAERSLRAGAKGYLMKSKAPELLVSAIREVANGRIYVSGNLAQRLLHVLTQPAAAPSERADDLKALSAREFAVFELIGRGKTAKEIAHMLGISSKTVDVHRVRIRDKLNIQTNPDLIHHAVRWVQAHEGGTVV
ncbi:MAG: response regulator transcription factor [Prosthecobacter sp.]|uniref:response regulator n=1 Tax=Prosthecobacter sp. TaxID=1965333 RepID=UPI0025EEE470|nr:response regulator transcription factor [Prosthecobacter sp.]MCF7785773.1 response regulator transcription factor [Prosthecobacter sp.]